MFQIHPRCYYSTALRHLEQAQRFRRFVVPSADTGCDELGIYGNDFWGAVGSTYFLPSVSSPRPKAVGGASGRLRPAAVSQFE